MALLETLPEEVENTLREMRAKTLSAAPSTVNADTQETLNPALQATPVSVGMKPIDRTETSSGNGYASHTLTDSLSSGSSAISPLAISPLIEEELIKDGETEEDGDDPQFGAVRK